MYIGIVAQNFYGGKTIRVTKDKFKYNFNIFRLDADSHEQAENILKEKLKDLGGDIKVITVIDPINDNWGVPNKDGLEFMGNFWSMEWIHM